MSRILLFTAFLIISTACSLSQNYLGINGGVGGGFTFFDKVIDHPNDQLDDINVGWHTTFEIGVVNQFARIYTEMAYISYFNNFVYRRSFPLQTLDVSAGYAINQRNKILLTPYLSFEKILRHPSSERFSSATITSGGDVIHYVKVRSYSQEVQGRPFFTVGGGLRMMSNFESRSQFFLKLGYRQGFKYMNTTEIEVFTKNKGTDYLKLRDKGSKLSLHIGYAYVFKSLY